MARKNSKQQERPEIPPLISPVQGIVLLQRQHERGQQILDGQPWSYEAFAAWANSTREFLVHCFGSSSENVTRFVDLGGMPFMWSTGEPQERWDELWKGRLRTRLRHLDSCIEILQVQGEFAENQAVVTAPPQSAISTSAIFLVHGRDDGIRQTVARFMETLGLQVIILDEQPNRGRTIIEKFEDHAAEAGYAVVLMTADDRGGLKTDEPSAYKPRARQNVFFELGYFSAKLGRERVCALHESGVEIPTDYQAVNYVPIDAGSTWKLLLGRELRDAGLPVDMNKA